MSIVEIDKKLESIGAKSKFKNDNSSKLLETLEKQYNFYLNEDYRSFLLKYGELSFEYDIRYTPLKGYPWTSNNKNEMITNFYGLNHGDTNLGIVISTYLGRIPNNLIPIAECPGGDQICLGISDTNFGKVYLWNHEHELEALRMLYPSKVFPEVDDYFENIYLIAETFVDFIKSFIIYRAETPKEKLDKIKVNVNEDFFND